MLSLYLSLIEDHRNDEKFEKLYYKYKAKMYSVAVGILKNEALAEDAVQDAFFSLARNIEKLDISNEKGITSYVYVTVKNAAFKIHNDKKAHETLDIDEFFSLASEDDVALSLEGDERYRELVAAILKLPTIYSDVLTLHYAHGLSAAEIAKELKLSRSAVKSRLSRGNEKLTEIIKKVYG